MLRTKGACNEVQIKLQGTLFQIDLNVLPLGVCDVVLGTQWLYSLGFIQWNFKNLTMQFDYQNKSILLQGLKSSAPILQDGDQFLRTLIKNGLVLQIVSCSPPLPLVQQSSAVTNLLLEFKPVFDMPKGLPPLRGHEHQISLKEGSSPVCERPYRYPFLPKN